MRASYMQPSHEDFAHLFAFHSRGAGLKNIRVYQPQYRSRGGSIFGIIRSIAKTAVPFLKRMILPELGNFTQQVVSDAANNIPMGLSLKRNLKQSARNLGNRIVRGGSRKKSKKSKTVSKKNKPSKKRNNKKRCVRKVRDLFEHVGV